MRGKVDLDDLPLLVPIAITLGVEVRAATQEGVFNFGYTMRARCGRRFLDYAHATKTVVQGDA